MEKIEFNTSSLYYNDVCNIDESENGIDIIIKDRIINYVEKTKLYVKKNAFYLIMIITNKELNVLVLYKNLLNLFLKLI